MVFNTGFAACYNNLIQHRNSKNLDLDIFVENEFIKSTIDFLKNIRNEYYVSSTVHFVSSEVSTLNLFESGSWSDINLASPEIMFLSLQQLVPSQRLIFNLHVIEGKSLNDAAMLVESSVETAKSNLEKARFHLQKNIEKNLNK
jgi:DNA-directed RNA polymerase specialized sigma24 family protein